MKRKFIYKKVKVLKPFCPECGQQLDGDGSFATPYRCTCGVWKLDWMTPGEYEIIPEPKQE